ncbi:DUF5819 family protein [Streptomyces sp. ZYX-F-203]
MEAHDIEPSRPDVSETPSTLPAPRIPPEATPPSEAPASPPREGAREGPEGRSSQAPVPTEARSRLSALSFRYRVGALLAVTVVAVTACVHIGMVFLHVAPDNTLSRRHAETIDAWIYPEFEQNWKLFAPNPLQRETAVEARAEVRTADGDRRTTEWHDLSAEDGRAIDGDPAPSHTRQNQLRRAWDFFLATHDGDDRPLGSRGALSESYLRRLAVLRLDRDGAAGADGTIHRVQLRARTTDVPPPEWSREGTSPRPHYRELPWWSVPHPESGGVTG